jgi:hypothetical protein
MEQKKWIPAPNVKQNAERHCGNCGRSIKYQRRNGDDKMYACNSIMIKRKDFDMVISTYLQWTVL